MSGDNEGLPIGMPALEQFVPNLQKKHYYLIGGNTGSGKTTLMKDKFFLTPFEHVMHLQQTDNERNIDVEGLYFSFEIDTESLIAGSIARRIYLDTKEAGHPLSLNVNYIMSRGKHRISQEHYDLVRSYDKYWEFFEDKVTFYDTSMTVPSINAAINDLAARNGKVFKTQDGHFLQYIPDNPNKYLVVYIDHLALTELSRGKSLVETMEELSHSIVKARNAYHMTFIVIQQLNMDLFDPVRVKIGRLGPMLSDFGDSKKISRDAEVVLALHNPAMFAQASYSGYDIQQLRSKFRSVEILKNRYGELDKKLGVFFNGEVGILKELPAPNSPDMLKVYEMLKTA
jgi:energy-coupling factor transporter ATP-binding protein EcfA2